MPFVPIAERNSIVEVVFGLALSGPLTREQIDTILSRHAEIRSELPRVQRGAPFPLPTNLPFPEGLIFPPQFETVSFDRMKPDGTMDWRLRVEGNNVFVNCLDYEGWPQTWERAERYMRIVTEAIDSDETQAQAIILQYINLFEWRDAAAYDLNQLLTHDGGFPQQLFERGHLWHSHRGWFVRSEGPAAGRTLERLHLDAVENETGVPTVKIDTYLQLQLDESLPARHFFANEGTGGAIFNALHDQVKAVFGGVLNPEMVERVGLYARN